MKIVKAVKIAKEIKMVKEVKIVKKVTIVKEVKRSDGSWRFGCADVCYC